MATIRTIHIPYGSPEATHAAIENSLTDDELVFDAGGYVFGQTVHLKSDRRYIFAHQNITVSDNFQGEYLFEIEDKAAHYLFYECRIRVTEKCKAFHFVETGHYRGEILDNFVTNGKDRIAFHWLSEYLNSSLH